MNDPYHVYMDLDVINSDYNSTSKPQLRFEETRNTPFLPGDSADYFCSIVRFNIQTGNTLPVFIPRIETGQSDVNKTIYQVAILLDMGEEGSTAIDRVGFASVMYTPEDESVPIPAPPTTSQDLSTTYYYNYNYQHFIHLVNKAIQSAWDNLKANYASTGSGGIEYFNANVGNTVAPWIDFDPGTNRIFITADDRTYNSELTGTTLGLFRLKLIFNDRLYELFASMPFRLIRNPVNVASIQSLSGRESSWYSIRFINRYNNKFTQKVIDPTSTATPQATISIDVLQAHQEMTSIALWNPVASIIFASSLLPIVPTQTSAPRDIGSQSNNLISGGNNSNLLPILSDFSIAVDGNNQYRPMVEYNPGAEYRLIDMNSTTNLNRIDIIVYWKDRFGGIHPFQMQPGCAASVKIMFRRKDFSVVS